MAKSKLILAAVTALALSGCSTVGTHSAYVADKSHKNWFSAAKKDPLNKGKANFRAQNFGLAERNFREAVEVKPRNAEAWLGLAASYDQLGRFDLADRAYDEVVKIKGPLPEILNNRGYSYYLRGNFKKAQKILSQAARSAPEDQRIQGNLELVRNAKS